MSAQPARVLQWTPPGPVAAAYFRDRSRVSVILGPIGGGKTVTCVQKKLTMALEQPVGKLTGLRRRKTTVVRNTYAELKQTTIRSFFEWLPVSLGKYQDSENPPSFLTRFELSDRTRLEWEVLFLALDRPEDVRKLLSMDMSDAYINEVREIHPDVLTGLNSRIGRFPPVRDAECMNPCIDADTNAPDDEHWIFDKFETGKTPPGWRLFKQPSGRSPQAENLANLPKGYYENIVANSEAWFVRTMVDAQYGYSRHGEPVFPEFNDQVHVAPEPLPYVAGLPVILGLDQGLNCAGLIFQPMPDGQRRYLAEVIPGRAGPTHFAQCLVEALTLLGVRSVAEVQGYADPAGDTGADTERGEATWMMMVAQQSGVVITPAPSNELGPRLDAVRRGLTTMIDGRKPAILISPTCRTLRKALNSGYRYKTIRTPLGPRTDAKPDKNEFSHVADAMQYGELGLSGLAALMRRPGAARGFRAQPFAAKVEINPL